jgi:hypothetical protein
MVVYKLVWPVGEATSIIGRIDFDEMRYVIYGHSEESGNMAILYFKDRGFTYAELTWQKTGIVTHAVSFEQVWDYEYRKWCESIDKVSEKHGVSLHGLCFAPLYHTDSSFAEFFIDVYLSNVAKFTWSEQKQIIDELMRGMPATSSHGVFVDYAKLRVSTTSTPMKLKMVEEDKWPYRPEWWIKTPEYVIKLKSHCIKIKKLKSE